MKIFIVSIIAVLLMNSAYAERHENRHEARHEWRYEGRHDGYSAGRHEARHESNYDEFGRWIAPALLGGFIAYELTRPHVVYAQPVYQPAVIVRKEVYRATPVYKEFVEYDPGCNCYMHIQRQIGWR